MILEVPTKNRFQFIGCGTDPRSGRGKPFAEQVYTVSELDGEPRLDEVLFGVGDVRVGKNVARADDDVVVRHAVRIQTFRASPSTASHETTTPPRSKPASAGGRGSGRGLMPSHPTTNPTSSGSWLAAYGRALAADRLIAVAGERFDERGRAVLGAPLDHAGEVADGVWMLFICSARPTAYPPPK